MRKIEWKVRRIVEEAMDKQQLKKYADYFSDVLNKFDAVSANFDDEYVYDESMEFIIDQIKRARAEQVKLVKMLNSSKYGRP